MSHRTSLDPDEIAPLWANLLDESLVELGLPTVSEDSDPDSSMDQRDRIKELLSLIESIEEKYNKGAPVDVVIERAEIKGMAPATVEYEIEKLKQKGEVYEHYTDHLRTT